MKLKLTNEKDIREIPNRLVIIPARGGSKRIPRKNLVDVCGSPIINYSLGTAISSRLFREILVSSDDQEIINHVRTLGNISTSKRPTELSGDYATVFSVLKHEYEIKKELGISYDEIWLLSATACLLGEENLIRLAAAFRNSQTASAMLAVTEYEVPLEWAMSIDDKGKLRSLDFESFKRRSQDLNKFYHDAGCLAVFSPSVFEDYEDGIPEGQFEPFILERNLAVDIDSQQDLELVRALMARKKNLF